MQSKKTNLPVILLMCVCVLSACTSTPKTLSKTHYQCDRGTELSVTFTEKGVTTVRGGRNSMPRYEIKNVAANVTLSDGTIINLPVQKTASGFMYSNGKFTFRGEGKEAMWSVGKMLAERCEIKH